MDAGYPPGIDGLALPSIARRSMKLLEECYAVAARIAAYSHVGVQLTKQTLRSSLEATSFAGHMEHEGLAQLYVRLLTKNFEEAILARREGRAPEFLARRRGQWRHDRARPSERSLRSAGW